MPLLMGIAAKHRELCQQQQLQLIMPNSGKNKMRESFAYLHRIVICRAYEHDTCQHHKHGSSLPCDSAANLHRTPEKHREPGLTSQRVSQLSITL
ncbi:hypothetical protein BT69DRAFT_543547 [Atractiella rhizophila]|nr:hypothetical protein BT69DRAFT_543547 [Atractiella rhizophila]